MGRRENKEKRRKRRGKVGRGLLPGCVGLKNREMKYRYGGGNLRGFWRL
jgi:hypothetical protein